MEFKGQIIKSIKVVNNSNNGEVVAEITDNHTETTNGYEVIIETLINNKE